jgi:hypothetical protein
MDNYNYDFFGQCEASAPDFTLTTFDGEKQLIGTCRGGKKGNWQRSNRGNEVYYFSEVRRVPLATSLSRTGTGR